MLHYRKYTICENSPWVTLIHGAGGSSAVWYKQLKEYKKHFNLLLIDLRGHGKSQNIIWKKGDNFEHIAEEIIAVLDYEKIEQTHFVGLSLGTIVIQTVMQKYPHRIHSIILSGAVTNLNFRTEFLIGLGNTFKNVIPYMWLYKFFAWIMMPRQNHKEARFTFVQLAKKMCQKEFIRWFSLTKNLNPFLKKLQTNFHSIPTLFVMGKEDHLFLNDVQDIVLQDRNNLFLQCLDNAGHVCNIDQPENFNRITINFLKTAKI